ncbi:hypothetical protein NL676_017171 [Syzygium grande]|nr:hypothetical protein NL676_017171 [Syzygium grande]
MALNSSLVVSVAKASASACQWIACNPERFGSEEVLYLLFCFPCENLQRFGLSLWACLCFPSLDPPSSDSDPHSD